MDTYIRFFGSKKSWVRWFIHTSVKIGQYGIGGGINDTADDFLFWVNNANLGNFLSGINHSPLHIYHSQDLTHIRTSFRTKRNPTATFLLSSLTVNNDGDFCSRELLSTGVMFCVPLLFPEAELPKLDRQLEQGKGSVLFPHKHHSL
ncbi:hypothetical protein MJT46_016192 [Ovis ammon polii x Ovis aries]|nr:hypothetical protein MJT46_016192 [Ovis ammon polii x Ovis aries]